MSLTLMLKNRKEWSVSRTLIILIILILWYEIWDMRCDNIGSYLVVAASYCMLEGRFLENTLVFYTIYPSGLAHLPPSSPRWSVLHIQCCVFPIVSFLPLWDILDILVTFSPSASSPGYLAPVLYIWRRGDIMTDGQHQLLSSHLPQYSTLSSSNITILVTLTVKAQGY